MPHAGSALITVGAYDNVLLDATLYVDDEDLSSFIEITPTVPLREGATRASLTITFYNMAGDLYGMDTGVPFDDVPLGVPTGLLRQMEPLLHNTSYYAAPGTSRLCIDSIYWYDEDWNLIDQAEGVAAWSWYRDPADAPATAIPV